TVSRLLRSLLICCVCLSLSACVRGGAAVPSTHAPKSHPEEVALVDAFGELLGWVGQNKDAFDASAMPVCVVLGDSDDPSDGTVQLLRKKWQWVEPASKCPFQD